MLRNFNSSDFKVPRISDESQIRMLEKERDFLLEEKHKLKDEIDKLNQELLNNSNKDNSLIQENENLKNELISVKKEIEDLKQEVKEKSEHHQIQLSEIKKQIQEKHIEISSIKNESNRFKELIANFLNRPDLIVKPEVLIELFLERTKTKKEEIVEPELETADELELFDLKAYEKSRECFCGKEKRWGSKGCEKCAKLCDTIRNRPEIGGRGRAWVEVWKKYGKVMTETNDDSMEESTQEIIEDEEELSTSD